MVFTKTQNNAVAPQFTVTGFSGCPFNKGWIKTTDMDPAKAKLFPKTGFCREMWLWFMVRERIQERKEKYHMFLS